MVQTLPPVEVVRRYVEEAPGTSLPAMYLRWGPARGQAERLWELPEGVCVVGPAPERFGFRFRRLDGDDFAVSLLWGRTSFHWPSVPRVELLASCLAPLLGALGLDLWGLLDDSARPAPRLRRRAA
jgi:hypothetical protein